MNLEEQAKRINEWINECIRVSGRHWFGVLCQIKGEAHDQYVCEILAIVNGHGSEHRLEYLELKCSLLDQAVAHYLSLR